MWVNPKRLINPSATDGSPNGSLSYVNHIHLSINQQNSLQASKWTWELGTACSSENARHAYPPVKQKLAVIMILRMTLAYT